MSNGKGAPIFLCTNHDSGRKCSSSRTFFRIFFDKTNKNKKYVDLKIRKKHSKTKIIQILKIDNSIDSKNIKIKIKTSKYLLTNKAGNLHL